MIRQATVSFSGLLVIDVPDRPLAFPAAFIRHYERVCFACA
jgi:hypothetical protein